LAGFLHCAVETRWQRFGQFPNDFLYKNLNFLYENLNFLHENLNDFLLDFLNDSEILLQ